MLSLHNISLTHFKNYDVSHFNFSKNVIGICGLNGIGKTNLLDAIYYCCFTKSYFTVSDQLSVNFTKEGFRLAADFNLKQEQNSIICIHRGTGKKEFLLNGVQYEKLSAHIGLLPAVIIAPDDVEIIIGGSEGRRRYLDSIICQLDPNYLQQVMLYNKVMAQRNSLLKRFAELGKIDKPLLEIINDQLLKPGNEIYNQRTHFTDQLIPLIESFYLRIADSDEKVTIKYQSDLQKADFETLLNASFEKDRVLQRTTVGLHKDDLFFNFNDQSFKTIASQGQRKSLLFALKLAQYELLKKYKNFSPILLLDDVFEKLDEQRMDRLLAWVCKDNNGQVFITDTHKQRLESIFEKLDIDGQLIEL